MEFEFITQRTPECVTTLDIIELYNCEDMHMNGKYTVAEVEPETGEVMLIGMGPLSGHITTVNFSGAK